MTRTLLIITLLYLVIAPLSAQTDEEQDTPLSVNEGTLVGIGHYNIKNTYLSDIKYTGWGLRILNERMRKTSLFDNRLSAQQIFYVDLSSTYNPAKTIGALSGFVEYSYGYHYRFQPSSRFKLLAGGAVHGLLGFLYNTQSSNNPFALNADVDLNLSGVAIYSLHIRKYPLTLRYQLDIPFTGASFAPKYGQSYYEIFGLGNYDGIISFTSLHNKFAMRNYMTVDFPAGNFTIRAGYFNKLYYTDIHNIQTRHLSHYFMVGFAKEFVSFGGKKLKNKHLYQSAYY